MRLKKFLKITGIVSASLVGIAILVIAGVLYNEHTERKERQAERDALQINVSVDSKMCGDKKFPLFISVVNKYHKTLKSFKFDIEIYRPGQSNDLNAASYSEREYEWNTIIAPTEGYAHCYSMPRLSQEVAIESLIFKPTVSWLYLDYYEPGEFIPTSPAKNSAH